MPEDLRIANIIHLVMKGRRGKTGSDKPDRLSSVVGKLLEAILRDRSYVNMERTD